MNRTTIGIDNGASGSVAIIGEYGSIFEPIPTKQQLLGRGGKVVTRIDHAKLRDIIEHAIQDKTKAHAYVERPFTGKFLNAVLPAQRAYEAALISLEILGIGFETVDSRDWQKPVLGAVKGSANLKRASHLRGSELYPQHAAAIADQGDADGLLIAHHFHHR
jgi:hypothetical protein